MSTEMTNQQQGVAQKTNQQLLREKLNNDIVKQKFQEVLGKKANAFVASLLQISSQNKMLADAEPNSVIQSAMVAATLDLPLNANLGFAYIIPYNVKTKGKNGQPDTFSVVAQFQMGYKGFIQLAQRSGQFKTLGNTEVYEGQLVEENPLTGNVFDWSKKKSDKVIGYAAQFELLNGFSKTLYMPKDSMDKHGAKYSKSFTQAYGLWKTDYDAMANKTVLKLLLSKFAPLSIEMQTAQIADQAIINDSETLDVTYTDNEDVAAEVAQEISENANKKEIDFKEDIEEAKVEPTEEKKEDPKPEKTKKSVLDQQVPSAGIVTENNGQLPLGPSKAF